MTPTYYWTLQIKLLKKKKREICLFKPKKKKKMLCKAITTSLNLQKHVGKVVGGFGKKSCVSTGVRKPGNTCASPTAMI